MDENRKSSDIQEEFDRLYLEYRPKLMQLVFLTVNDEYLTEDIVQEIFYEAWRHREKLVHHPNQSGWLYRATQYKIRECLRKKGRREKLTVDSGEIEIPCEESGYSKAELELMMCETLTPDEQIRFRRYFLWGEATAEIAEKENITENNMRVRISRLKKKMEKTMGKNG